MSPALHSSIVPQLLPPYIQLGDAILYLTTTPHRGTQNLSKKTRPVLDIAFFENPKQESDSYFANQGFLPVAQEEMERHRSLFDKLRHYTRLGELWDLAKRVDELW